MRRGGQLTEAVRRKPYSVVLFDEVEKAHPDVFNVLLQVLDDGRITDSQGRTVDLQEHHHHPDLQPGQPVSCWTASSPTAASARAPRDQVEELLKRSFRPEFLNRLDEIVFYKPLTKENITGIIDLLVQDLNRRLESQEISVRLTSEAKDVIIDRSYDPAFGARPLRRYVQHTVETLIARKLIAGDVMPGTTLTVTVQNGELAVD